MSALPRLILITGWIFAATNPAAGDEVAELQKPFGMHADVDGTIYVADIEANHIAVFNDNLNRVRTIDRIEGYGSLLKPFDIKRHNGRFYILETGRSNVLIVDATWQLVNKIGIGQPGSEPGQFSEPHGLTIAADGTLYVADTLNHRIQVFDENGGFLRSIDATAVGGTFPLNSPAGIGVLPDGRLVVSEYGDHPPVIADAQGRVLQTLEPLGLAYGVAVGSDRFAIVATYNNTVDVYDHTGKRVTRLHNAMDSDSPGAFNKPGGVAFDPNGRLVVNEWRNHRLQIFDTDGRFVRAVGGRTPKIDQDYPAHSRRFADRPVLLSAFTAVLSPKRIRQYHDAGIDKLYVQPSDDLQQLALREAVDAAHALGMQIDFVFDTFMHGTRPAGEFAQAHPEFYTRKRDGQTQNQGMLSYAYPEVRQWKVRQIIDALKTSGADGVVLDYIRWPAGNTDGYDPPAMHRFEQLYGEDARAVDPLDPRWVALRASYITQLLSELRTAIDQMDRPITVGVYVDADPAMELEAVGRNWPVWSQLNLVDQTHHMLYTADFDVLYGWVRTAVQNTGPGTWIASCLDVYAGYLSSPDMLREGVRVSILAGANEIVIVRDGSIERMGLFDTIRQIADELETAPDSDPAGTSHAYTARYTDEPIVLDGQLDEPTWHDAQRVEQFYLFRPDTGNYNRTTVGRMAWDEDHLYVAFICEDDDVRSASSIHDDYLAAGDVVELYIKYGQQHLQYYELVSAPNGTTFDARWPHRGAGDFKQFTSWESGMRVASSIRGTPDQSGDTDEGYTVEWSIPWSAFDGVATPPADGTIWTFGMFRYDHSDRLSEPHLLMSITEAPEHGFHSYEAYETLVFSR